MGMAPGDEYDCSRPEDIGGQGLAVAAVAQQLVDGAADREAHPVYRPVAEAHAEGAGMRLPKA